MLELLHIENIAVIQEADIQFAPGFNALTGETGAGKSIVIDAMGAVLGGRTSRDLIRTSFPAFRRTCRVFRKTASPRTRRGASFCSGTSAPTGATSAASTAAR